MRELGSVLFLYTETPLHAGSGTALGAVDLPIQRERMSGLPMVQGSGIKGALREALSARHEGGEAWDDWDRALFGPRPPSPEKKKEGEEEEHFAGAMSVLDARLLLLPVRTVWGGWAWVTSPMVLERLARDLDAIGEPEPPWRALEAADGEARVGTGCTVIQGSTLLIEDLEYEARPEPAVDALAAWLKEHALLETPAYAPFADRLAKQLAVVGDHELRFLTEHATEVVTRVRINPETGAVANGALWTEESLPAESLLWSLAFFADARAPSGDARKAQALRSRLLEEMKAMNRIRLGGDRTVGRGLVGVRVHAVGGQERAGGAA